MKLFTEAQRKKLIANNNAQDGTISFDPVVKLFNPVGNGTWLLSELDPESNIAYGLCDLGMGFPELGYVSIDELERAPLPLGLKIERDIHWTPSKSMKEYADEAYNNGGIKA